MRSIPSFLLLPSPLWLGVVTPDRVLSMSQIEQFDIYTGFKQMTYDRLLEIELFGHLTVCKQITDV